MLSNCLSQMLGEISVSRHSCYKKRDLSGLFWLTTSPNKQGPGVLNPLQGNICQHWKDLNWKQSPGEGPHQGVLKEAGRNKMEGEDDCLWPVTVGSSQTNKMQTWRSKRKRMTSNPGVPEPKGRLLVTMGCHMGSSHHENPCFCYLEMDVHWVSYMKTLRREA